ncbi:MAG: glycosyltransferase family 4 protein [Candidatus Diapherotrites archaeon]
MSNKILYLSSYPPRECGLATFTRDVSDNIQKKFGKEALAKIIAINEDNSSLYNYGKKVVFNLVEQDIKSYEKAAEKINSMKGISLVNIQHEFGLFGGDHGEHILRLMELTNKKIVTTLHTVLEDPEPEMKMVVQKIFEYSDKVVVMTENAKEILTNDYGVDAEKLVVIPHGAPNIGFKEKDKLKKQMGFEGKTILLTFGLLSRGKGVEHTIRAMPEIVKQNKNVVYLIVGQTHPKVRLDEGESYRQELKELAIKNNVEKNVKFVDKYLTLQEITEFLKMADVYLAPSLDIKQICSGTVSYAMGAGKPIIASKNKYNEEVLADDRGILVKRNSGKSFAKQVNNMLASDDLRKKLEKNAFEYSRKMTWANVSTKYFNTFLDITGIEAETYSKLPRISFKHFTKMTDDFGIIQFSDYSTPDIKSGYTLDDNARALIVATKGYEKYGSKRMLKFTDTFLNFIEKCQINDGRFHNILDENREFTDDVGSEDSFGRTLLGVGTALNSNLPETYRLRAKKILEKTASQSPGIISPRAQADSLIGIINSNNHIPEWNGMKEEMLDSLVSKYENVSSDGWNWFEEYLTYGNSRLPEALFVAQDHFENKKVAEIAKDSIDFLTNTLFIKGKFVPIGQEKWFVKNEDRGFFDQQPIEAAEMTTAFVKAYEKTGNQNYLKKARNAFDWFLGKNSHNQMVYDESTGGCFDGLTKTGVNANQGAEAIVSYLIARLSI